MKLFCTVIFFEDLQISDHLPFTTAIVICRHVYLITNTRKQQAQLCNVCSESQMSEYVFVKNVTVRVCEGMLEGGITNSHGRMIEMKEG